MEQDAITALLVQLAREGKVKDARVLPADARTRHLVEGVVKGVGGYGNCVGVPTVGGEVNFHAAYDGNILVNAMTVGVAKTDKIFYSAASGIGTSKRLPASSPRSRSLRSSADRCDRCSAASPNHSSPQRPARRDT